MENSTVGTQINSCESLIRLAEEKRSVCDITGDRIKPAAIMINMQLLVVHRWIKNGLYEYIPKPKKAMFEHFKK